MKKTMMSKEHRTAYDEQVLKPIRSAVEKAGGRVAVAKKLGWDTGRLLHYLYGDTDMRSRSFFDLCQALNITLVFMDMNLSASQKVMSGLKNKP